jgi:hypothetical protein
VPRLGKLGWNVDSRRAGFLLACGEMAETPGFFRRWVVQLIALSSAALLLFWSFYAIDTSYFGHVGADDQGRFGRYFAFDPSSLSDTLSSLAGLIAAVFGIVITVVSIIVQLAANRFTGVTRMFLNDRSNRAVMTYYIVVCVCGVWLSAALQRDFIPRTALVGMLLMNTVGLVLMAPYFGYVFWFLEPRNIIARTRRAAMGAVERAFHVGRAGTIHDAQALVLSSMEELTDIASNSISGKDKIIASGAVDALKDFALAYIEQKTKAPTSWFAIGPGIRQNPDFVAMDPESLADLEQRRTWVEWKVMRQYYGIYTEALQHMRDINYLIAIDTRYIGEAALAAKDEELTRLVFRFLNSYLRATLNAGDVRTAYNVLNQYRLWVETMLRDDHQQSALEGVRYMKYYGHVGFDIKLPFVTETVAYDVSTLCEIANGLELDIEDDMLREFLELDRPLLSHSQEKGLLGVRKAQVKLACFYLARGSEAKARRIADDMRGEPAQRLMTIRQQLESVKGKDFWEIIDRGRNFEFMPEAQRKHLTSFFAWLESPVETPQVMPKSATVSSA